jgi:alkanesulfonate monooxygenase SsuD/methylene tetrahydromethanopterin reductase-like flavin-dependent oxidoreductase (luciferase family)
MNHNARLSISIVYTTHKEIHWVLFPFSISHLLRRDPPRRTHYIILLIWRSMLSAGAIAAAGWPSTTTWSASPAPPTSVVIGYVAGATKTIRVGSGGIMLPNHSPIVIAEQFGTLESLYPGRIDLGLGRAPGTDQRTLRALRRDATSADNFPHDVRELQAFLGPLQPGQSVQAVSWHWNECSHLDPWLESFWRAARSRVRVAFHSPSVIIAVGFASR